MKNQKSRKWLNLCVSLMSSIGAFAASENLVAATNAQLDCRKSALAKSECMIRAILEDIAITYTQVGGGGITEIKSLETNKYRAAIAQEGRVDFITYEFEMNSDGHVSIVRRTEHGQKKGP